MPPDLCVAGGLHGFVSMRGCFFIASEAKTIIIWRAHGPRLEKGKDGEEWRSMGHRAALGQLCSQSRFQLVAESNQTPPVWVPSGLLQGSLQGVKRSLLTAELSAGQPGAQQCGMPLSLLLFLFYLLCFQPSVCASPPPCPQLLPGFPSPPQLCPPHPSPPVLLPAPALLPRLPHCHSLLLHMPSSHSLSPLL